MHSLILILRRVLLLHICTPRYFILSTCVSRAVSSAETRQWYLCTCTRTCTHRRVRVDPQRLFGTVCNRTLYALSLSFEFSSTPRKNTAKLASVVLRAHARARTHARCIFISFRINNICWCVRYLSLSLSFSLSGPPRPYQANSCINSASTLRKFSRPGET